MSEQPFIQVEAAQTFNRNLRTLVKKYRSIRNDIQPVIEQLERGELPGEQIKLKYKLGQFLLGKVEYHATFGVFVNIGDNGVRGLIKIPDFLDKGEMSEQMYPEIGKLIGAIVVGYNDSNCREVYLSAKPSVLHEVLVPLRSRPVPV